MKPSADQLVAHRGWPSRYPENSLAGFAAALDAGARYIEFDVQLSRDAVPLVLHDESTWRTGGDKRRVFDLPASEIIRTPNGEPGRFGDRFSDSRVPTLAAAVELFAGYDGGLFVELKRQSIRHFGGRACLDRIAPIVGPHADHVTLISFDAATVGEARAAGFVSTGWVLKRWDTDTQRRAHTMRPDYLFISADRLGRASRDLPGDWRWVVYDVARPEKALALIARGASLIETDFIGEFLARGPDER